MNRAAFPAIAVVASLMLGVCATPAIGSDQVVTRDTFRNVSKKVSPAVVNVKIRSNINFGKVPNKTPALPPNLGLDDNLREEIERLHEQFLPFLTPSEEEEFKYARSASGVIIRADGYIVTSNHVVEKVNPGDLEISLSDGRSFSKVQLVGADELTDLAVLKMDASGLPAATWGDSDKLEVGDIVVAIGNPLEFNNSVSEGIVSAKHRMIKKAAIEDLIQTTAMINPGNSGGALVNLDGELIGINMAIATSTGLWSGLGFAIPSKTARDVTDQIIARGKVARGYLGIEMARLTNNLAHQLGYDQGFGIIVKDVVVGSAAEKAGLQRYDIIAKVNDAEIKDIFDMHRNVGARGAGETVDLEVWRDEDTTRLVQRRVKVQLDERPLQEDLQTKKAEPPRPGVKSERGILGLKVSPAPSGKGVIVDDVESGSRAALGGLKKGDVILQVNKRDVNSAEDLKKATQGTGAESHLFFIEREGSSAMVTIEEKQ
jgi:serine protease Do